MVMMPYAGGAVREDCLFHYRERIAKIKGIPVLRECMK